MSILDDPVFQTPSAKSAKVLSEAEERRRVRLSMDLAKPIKLGDEYFVSHIDCARAVSERTGRSASYILTILNGSFRPKNFGVGKGNYPRGAFVYGDRVFHTLKDLAKHVGRDWRVVKRHYHAGTLDQIDMLSPRRAKKISKPRCDQKRKTKQRSHFYETRGAKATAT